MMLSCVKIILLSNIILKHFLGNVIMLIYIVWMYTEILNEYVLLIYIIMLKFISNAFIIDTLLVRVFRKNSIMNNSL